MASFLYKAMYCTAQLVQAEIKKQWPSSQDQEKHMLSSKSDHSLQLVWLLCGAVELVMDASIVFSGFAPLA